MYDPQKQGDGYAVKQLALHFQILRECEEMAQFAFGMGRTVPGRAVETVESALIARDDAAASSQPYRPDAAAVRRLASAHEELSRLVAPARPNCLVLMDEEARAAGMLHFLGPVGLVRRLMGVSVVFLASFIALATFPGVGPDFDATVAKSGGVLSGSGFQLLGNMLFYIASAGLGAAFGLLFEVNGFIVDRTFDPKYESSYWIKMVLGMIAGFILVTLVPIQPDDTSFALPTIAMLGGFSASAVYRILNRLVETLESVVRGDAKEMVSAHQAAARARAEEDAAKSKMKMAAGLLQLQQQLGDGASSLEARRRLNEILSGVMPAFAFEEDDLSVRSAPNGNGGNGAAPQPATPDAFAPPATGATILVGVDTPIVVGPPPEEEAPAPEASDQSGEPLAAAPTDESGESGESGAEPVAVAAGESGEAGAPPADGELDENGAAG